MGGRVTVIIPCYNQAQWLPDAIESALAQTEPCRVIVVNDGSTDDTSQVARRYPVRLIEQPNRGLSAARNTGILAANTEWVVTLDSDDKLAPNMVEKCLQRRTADIVSCGMQMFGLQNKMIWFKEEPTFADFLDGNQIPCCALFRRSMWQDIGGYDEAMTGYEDWDFWLRATYNGYEVRTVRDALFFYRKHGPSMVDQAHARHDELVEFMVNKLYNQQYLG